MVMPPIAGHSRILDGLEGTCLPASTVVETLLTAPDGDKLLVMRIMKTLPKYRIGQTVRILLAAGPLLLPMVVAAQDGSNGLEAFVGARIIDGTGKPAVEKATLLIKNGRIAAVGRS